jgi:hypothetical protein
LTSFRKSGSCLPKAKEFRPKPCDHS